MLLFQNSHWCVWKLSFCAMSVRSHDGLQNLSSSHAVRLHVMNTSRTVMTVRCWVMENCVKCTTVKDSCASVHWYCSYLWYSTFLCKPNYHKEIYLSMNSNVITEGWCPVIQACIYGRMMVQPRHRRSVWCFLYNYPSLQNWVSFFYFAFVMLSSGFSYDSLLVISLVTSIHKRHLNSVSICTRFIMR